MTPDEADLAACRGVPDVSIFFAEKGENLKRDRARAICWTRCPVREQCLEEAQRPHSIATHGIWGGYTAQERQHLRALEGRPGFDQKTIDVAVRAGSRESFGGRR